MNCSICNKLLEPCWGIVSRPDKMNYLNGTATLISFGYGSVHDGEEYYLGLCDDCTTQYKDRLEFIHNFITGRKR